MDPQQWEILQQMLAARNQPPGMGSSQNAMANYPGMSGTPGGPVQESPVMDRMRAMQQLAALGLVGTGTASMFGAAGPLGVAAGQGQMAGGAALMDNSGAPNIRDVWADMLRMKMQGN